MQRLSEYLTLHPVLVSVTLAMALAVLAWELWLKRTSYAAILSQEVIQLMNQGAPVYDLRTSEDFAAGHISGARHLAATQQELAAEHLKKFRDKLLLVVCEDGSRSSALTRTLHAAGFTKVFNRCNAADGSSAVTAAVLMYTTSWCGFCARARRLFTDKGVAFTDIDVEQVEGAREEMRSRSGRNTVPQIFVGARHLGGYDDTRALDEKGELDPLLQSAAAG
jgi:glutaredoxin 3